MARGARSRATVLARAVDLASSETLEALTFGRLADDVGMSKAGIQGLFHSKEELQIATIFHARALFIDFVVRPTRSSSPGEARLRALIERWIEYAERPLFEGGCFQGTNVPVYDTVFGSVRDQLQEIEREWLDLVAQQLTEAAMRSELAVTDIDLVSFQLDAALKYTNVRLRMGDPSAVTKLRQTVNSFFVSTAWTDSGCIA